MMESHHQNMSRLIAEWCHQQEKGLTWKEWAEDILDGRPIEGAPLEETDLNRRVRMPRIDHTGLVSPNARGCADSPSGFSIIQIVGGGAPTDP